MRPGFFFKEAVPEIYAVSVSIFYEKLHFLRLFFLRVLYNCIKSKIAKENNFNPILFRPFRVKAFPN
jgi:hypothetical protein